MKENLVSLAKLLVTDDAFNLAFSSRSIDEEKYELAKTKFTDLTREDFSEFLKNLRETEKVNLTELSPDELEMVAGGVGGWATKLAAATMLITTLGATGVMSQQADAMKSRHTGSSSGQTSTQGCGAPQSVFTPVGPGMVEVIRADWTDAFQNQTATTAGTTTQQTQPESVFTPVGPGMVEVIRADWTDAFQNQTATTAGTTTQQTQPESVFTPVGPGMVEVIRADWTDAFQNQTATTAGTTTQQTQPGIHQFVQRQAPAHDLNFIKLGPPRSGEVSYEFDHGEKTAQKIFQKHHERNKAVGSSSLIGELAQIVESFIRIRKEPMSQLGITFFGAFKNPENDIIAENCGSYDTLIENMKNVHSATRENAAKILENLSKPCRWPKDSQPSNGFNLEDFEEAEFSSNFVTNLFNDLFDGLNDESKAFVAVLLCESIRFNDDGAFARWSIREIIGGCNDKNLGESYIEYKKMYTTTKTEEGEDTSAIAPFAPKGGKAITTNLIHNEPARKVNGSIKKAKERLEHIKEKMEEYKQFISPPISPRKDRESLNEEHNQFMTDIQEENGLDELSYILPKQDGEMPSAELPGCQIN